jgi:TolB protein
MNGDGSGRTKLVDAEQFGDYRWSPDGSRIAYAAARSQGGDVFSDVWIIRPDASGKLRLVVNAESPTWSPDGSQIAYFSDRADLHIRIVNSDGSGDRRLTPRQLGAFQPAWSPDGARIAFVSLDPNGIRLINPDGSGLVDLTHGLGQEDTPTWSPDGSKIAFNTGPLDESLESDVAVINRDGSGRTNLTNRPGFDLSPDWSPDGSRIVYVRAEDSDNEIFVMNADGTGMKNVSNRPDSFDFMPDWGGPSRTVLAGRRSTTRSALLRIPEIRAPGWRLPRRERR